MSDGMRIALVGVIASLVGTLIGGGVTYAVTQSQISSTKAESRRAERLNAYSGFSGDTQRFWIYVGTIIDQGLHPSAITSAQRAGLNTYGEALIGDWAQIRLLAPRQVAHIAGELETMNVQGWNYLAGGTIRYKKLARLQAPLSREFKQFAHVTRADLGTP
jgi:hypothetical protein